LGQNGEAVSTVFRVDHLFLDFVALDPTDSPRCDRKQPDSHVVRADRTEVTRCVPEAEILCSSRRDIASQLRFICAITR
jgi:hypothetical protein